MGNEPGSQVDNPVGSEQGNRCVDKVLSALSERIHERKRANGYNTWQPTNRMSDLPKMLLLEIHRVAEHGPLLLSTR